MVAVNLKFSNKYEVLKLDIATKVRPFKTYGLAKAPAATRKKKNEE